MDYRRLGIEPVSDDMPAGNDVRYEDMFESLQTEIDKLASPAERDSFSWSVVNDLASTILKDQSKDILVASYLCVSLFHLKGGEGLDLATNIYDDLISTFWDDLFPLKKRMRGRAAAIEWWIEKTEAALENGLQLKVSLDVHKTIVERLNRIDAFLEQEKELKISVLNLVNKIKNVKPVIENTENKEGAVSKIQAMEQDNAVVHAPVSDTGITNADEALKLLTPHFQKIRQASKVIREDKPKNPQSYRWIRIALWDAVKASPLATNGITMLPPPSKQMVSHLNTLKDQEDWEGLVQASESALNNPKNIFLIDLNRLTAEALSNLGRKFNAAHDAVCCETLYFIKRLPGVEEMSFTDGTPFADDDTKNWLKTLNSGGQEDQFAANVFLNSEAESGVSDFLRQTTQEFKETGDIKSAVNSIQKKISQSASGKEALFLRIGLVQLLVTEKKEKLTLHHLEYILDELQKHRVDVWEPDIAMMGLKIAYNVFKTQIDKKYKDRTDEIFNKIAGISTVDAMTLS